jgi:hypothetical protein
MKIVEAWTASAKDDKTEDLIVETPHYFGVFDGVSGVKDWTRDGKTMGQWGSFLAGEALKELPANATAQDFAELASRKIAAAREEFGLGPTERLAATAIILPRRCPLEVWAVGDSHFGYRKQGGAWASQPQGKLYDEITLAYRRVVVTQDILENGKPETQQDRAHLAQAAWACVQSALERQMLWVNHPDAAQNLAFGTLTGRPVPPHFVVVHRLPDDTAEIALCSDGLPEAFSTAEEGKAALAKLRAEDPFLSGDNALGFMGHKGGFVQMDGAIADYYDDVAYIRIEV